jgi:hypothetical protein
MALLGSPNSQLALQMFVKITDRNAGHKQLPIDCNEIIVIISLFAVRLTMFPR